MKVLYIYRHPNLGYSIGKVFRPIENEMKKYAEVDSIYLPVPNYSLKGLWQNIRYAQKHCKEKKYNVIHITGTENYLIPFIRKQKIVVTVHDLGSFVTNNPIINFFKNILFVKSLQLADRITCISDKTKNELLDRIKGIKNKVITIYNPVGTEYIYKPKVFNVIEPIILHVGTKSNKNLDNTIKALAGIKCHLRIIGNLSSKQKEILLQYNINYTNACGLSDEEILKEYECCDIVNFPSLYEGFGMPIIEGQSIGRLVITSDMEPMSSVAGGGSILCNPYDIKSIRSAYMKAIHDKNYRESIINKGLKSVDNYRLGYVTDQYLNLYNSF